MPLCAYWCWWNRAAGIQQLLGHFYLWMYEECKEKALVHCLHQCLLYRACRLPIQSNFLYSMRHVRFLRQCREKGRLLLGVMGLIKGWRHSGLTCQLNSKNKNSVGTKRALLAAKHLWWCHGVYGCRYSWVSRGIYSLSNLCVYHIRVRSCENKNSQVKKKTKGVLY